jgi:hypothetical protein
MDNDPQTTYARFAVKNVGGKAIKPESWLLEKPNSRLEDTSLRRSGNGFIGCVQTEIVTVLAPLEERPWRLHLSFSVSGFRHTAATCYAALFYNTRVYAATPDAIRAPPEYEVQSEWINPSI